MSREDLLSTYDYLLPNELIAREPLPRRDASRLMVVDRAAGTVTHRTLQDLPDLLQAGDCLVLNNSRVLPARLFGVRTATGGKWEGLYLSSTPDGLWRLIGQTRGYLRLHETVTLINNAGETLRLKLIEKFSDGVCHFQPSQHEAAYKILQRFGTVPLPPYLDRKQATEMDWERYQTTYALHPGSVAAPTVSSGLGRKSGRTPNAFGMVRARCGTRTIAQRNPDAGWPDCGGGNHQLADDRVGVPRKPVGITGSRRR